MHIAISGAGRGLGAALARTFLTKDSRLQLSACSRSSTPEYAAGKHERILFKHLDVADAPAVRAWAAESIERFGAPDFLLLCAAEILPNAPLWEQSTEHVERLLRSNVLGSIHAASAFLPEMIAAGSGGVLFFSSYWGRSAAPEQATYAASKWAIEGLARSLAEELPKGVFCCALNPGVIHTDMLATCFESSAAAYPGPDVWAESAAEYILKLDWSNNGASLTVPGY